MDERDQNRTTTRPGAGDTPGTPPSGIRQPDGSWTPEHRAALEAYAREIEREGLALARHRSF